MKKKCGNRIGGCSDWKKRTNWIQRVITTGTTGPGKILWTPADLSVAPVLWVEVGSSIEQVERISIDVDRVFDVRNLTQDTSLPHFISNASFKARWIADPNDGKRYLEFRGSQRMLCSAVMISSIFDNKPIKDEFWLYNLRGTQTSAQTLFAPEYGNAAFGVHIEHRADPLTRTSFKTATGQTFPVFNPGPFPGSDFNWYLANRRIESGVRAQAWLNGESKYNVPSANFSHFNNVVSAYLGGRSNVATNQWQGGFRGLIIGHEIYNDDERQRIEGYLMWNLGNPNDLPIGHPWREEPPYIEL